MVRIYIMASLTPTTTAAPRITCLRPIVAWVLVSLPLFALQYHQDQERKATIHFTVSMEGRSERPFYTAELNENSFLAGGFSGLGQKRLVISATNADPYITNLFIWYGGKHLGDIKLTRSRGILELTSNPKAIRAVVRGDETNITLTPATNHTLSLPTGLYQIDATLVRISVTQAVEISANQTRHVLIDPGITALHLTSQPTNAQFELSSIEPAGIFIRSNTPVLLTDMPSGTYSLRIWQQDYRKTIPVRLWAGSATNVLDVTFDYAQLAVSSEPSEAQIFQGNKLLGTTPVTLNLQPDSYRLAIVKGGCRTTNVSVVLKGSDVRSLTVVLPSIRYLDAIDRARRYLERSDYDRALAEASDALQIRPEDPTALELQRAAKFGRHVRDANEYRRRVAFAKALVEVGLALQIQSTNRDLLALKKELQREWETALQARTAARLTQPQNVFDSVVKPLPYEQLFLSHKIQTTGQLNHVRSCIIRALAASPPWNVSLNEQHDEDTVVIKTNLDGKGSKQNVVMVLGQTTDSDVAIYFKLLEFTLDTNLKITLKGFDPNSYVPLHPQHVNPFRAPFVEAQRRGSVDDFRKRIENELR